jgi:hypothetical protein
VNDGSWCTFCEQESGVGGAGNQCVEMAVCETEFEFGWGVEMLSYGYLELCGGKNLLGRGGGVMVLGEGW